MKKALIIIGMLLTVFSCSKQEDTTPCYECTQNVYAKTTTTSSGWVLSLSTTETVCDVVDIRTYQELHTYMSNFDRNRHEMICTK